MAVLPFAPFYHDGEADFPHGAGASCPGWYRYDLKDASAVKAGTLAPEDVEVEGPWVTEAEAATAR